MRMRVSFNSFIRIRIQGRALINDFVIVQNPRYVSY
jgi:hypothetical protein